MTPFIHEPANLTDINIDRTVLDTAPAPGTGHAGLVLVHVVFEFVHKTLTHPLDLLPPGIMTGGMQGKKWKHARVPVTNPNAGTAIRFVLDVKTPACGTKIGANPAVDAGKMHFFPEIGLVEGKGVKFCESGCIHS